MDSPTRHPYSQPNVGPKSPQNKEEAIATKTTREFRAPPYTSRMPSDPLQDMVLMPARHSVFRRTNVDYTSDIFADEFGPSTRQLSDQLGDQLSVILGSICAVLPSPTP